MRRLPRLPRHFAAAFVLSTIYFAVSMAVLAFGHPHEDAFILFKYARNFARSAGIVYYPGGPHAEGATDFVWMVLLAGAVRAGADVAVAAAFFNTVGFFLASLLLLRRGGRFGPVFAAVLLLSPAATASYVGFGAMLYGACALGLFVLYIDGSERGLLAVPWLALLLGLLRPDGVVLGGAFALLAALRARRSALSLRYAMACAGCVAIGAGYFLWRWRYFGMALPLPLYVKSHFRGWAPGWDDAVDWSLSTVLPLVGLAVAGRWLLGTELAPPRRALEGLGAFAVHAACFALNLPSQNVANRFEAPAALALLYVVATLAARPVAPSPWRAASYGALVVFSQAPLLPIVLHVARESARTEYVDEFALALPGITEGRARIAVTEAGRLTYYADDPVLDLDGLNSPETARRPPGADLLDRFHPDVVMIHHAGTLEEARFGATGGDDVVRLAGPLALYVTPGYAPLFAEALRRDLPSYDALRLENQVAAPIATMAWLDRRGGYELYAVRFKSNRWIKYHLYAVRADSPFKDAMIRELAESHREDRALAYLPASRLRRGM